MNSEKDLVSRGGESRLRRHHHQSQQVDYHLVFEKAQLIFDARNALKDIAKKSPKVVKL